MDEIIIEKNQFQKAMVIMLVGFIVLLVGALLIFGKNIFGSFIVTKIIAAIMLILSLALFRFIIKKMGEIKDRLVINEEGITDEFSTLSIGFISWSNIKDVYVCRVATEEYVCIDLKNMDRVLEKLPVFKKNIINYNISKTKAPICINCNSRAYTNKQIEEIIKNKIRAYSLR